jgi:hypothetical protein
MVGHDLDMFMPVEPEVEVNPEVLDSVRGSDLVLLGMPWSSSEISLNPNLNLRERFLRSGSGFSRVRTRTGPKNLLFSHIGSGSQVRKPDLDAARRAMVMWRAGKRRRGVQGNNDAARRATTTQHAGQQQRSAQGDNNAAHRVTTTRRAGRERCSVQGHNDMAHRATMMRRTGPQRCGTQGHNDAARRATMTQRAGPQ